MNKSSMRYFDLAYQYQIAALTLYHELLDAPYLYNPIAYLFRQTVELQLKGLIIQEVKQIGRKPVAKIKIGSHKMNSMHSLVELWDYYLSITHKSINTAQTDLINKVVKHLNKSGYVARFRYPDGKSSDNPNKRIVFPLEPIKLDTSNVAPDLADAIPNIAISQTKVKVIKKGPRILTMLPNVIEATECLFDLAGY